MLQKCETNEDVPASRLHWRPCPALKKKSIASTRISDEDWLSVVVGRRDLYESNTIFRHNQEGKREHDDSIIFAAGRNNHC